MPKRPDIDIRPDHWEIVRSLLGKHVPQYAVWAFGSRAKWTAKDYSDLDLAVITDKPLTLRVSSSLSDDFSESDLPWKVDVVDWATTSDSFRKIILEEYVVVQVSARGRNRAMSAEWQDTTIGAVCSKVFSGGTPTSTNPDYYGGAIPWLRTKEVNYGKIFDTEQHITQLGLENSSAKFVPINSVIVAMYGNGDTAGRVAINKIPLATNQACCNLVINPARADFRFVYYYLMGRYQELVDLKNGGAQQNLNGQLIKAFPFAAPDIDEQSAIADVFESLDDRITLLRETNATLEAIAQALFKSWFVDFDPVRAKLEGRTPEGMDEATAALFPDGFEESELGLLPRGWRVSSMSQVCKISSGNRPGLRSDSANENAPIPLFGGAGIMGFTNEALFSVRKILTGRVGTLGKVHIAYPPFWASDNVLVLAPEDSRSFHFCFHWLNSIDVHALNRGSTQPLLTQKDLGKQEHIFPTDFVLDAFGAIAEVIYGKIRSNELQAQTLATLRDTLLPCLISGHLRLPDESIAMSS